MFFKKRKNTPINGYKLIKKVGEGRYGICYLATKDEESFVIIKQFKKTNDKNNHAFEAVMLSQIDHEAIPQLLGVINRDDFYGFILEHKAGWTLEQMLFKQHYRFTPNEIFHIGCQLIQILKHLHDKNIVHRDIRIPNVVIHNGKVSLIDFGLARWVNKREYQFDQDFSYLGDLLLYLHYSSYTTKSKKERPWYEELNLKKEQIHFYKRLLKLETPYSSIIEVEKDFIAAFA